MIGILSDTHGRTRATAAALHALKMAGATTYIHCGDVGDEKVFDLMAGLELAFVWGNCDQRRTSLAGYAKVLGLVCHGEKAELQVAGKRLAVTHGDNPVIVRDILRSKQFDYLLQGHTHVAKDSRVQNMRMINPGALHRTASPSVAVLDPSTDALRFIPVDIDD